MKAARFHAHGPPSVLQIEEVADPAPRAGEALVRVRACALNHLDLFLRRGLERVRIPLPHIAGADVAGEILEAADSDFIAGQRVLLQPGLSCGRCAACLAGRDNACPHYDVLGSQSNGGYAEVVRIPLQNLVPVPDAIGYTEAAAFPLTFLTAWHMLLTRALLVAGETVLVLGAGSGVGQAAIQIARLHGARVVATAGGADKMGRARALGADDVLDPYTDDIVSVVRDLTDGRGVDIVVEHVGTATWDRSLRCLARGGRLVTCGATTGHDANLDLRFLFTREYSLLGSYMGTKAELLRAASFFFAGHLRPVIDCELPLADVVHAHERLEKSEQFGKIVLTL